MDEQKTYCSHCNHTMCCYCGDKVAEEVLDDNPAYCAPSDEDK